MPPASSLKILRLGWSGRCFGHRTVEALDRLGLCSNLKVLELSGLYRLKDSDLVSLLDRCKKLTCLEMPYKSTLSVLGAKAITAPTLPLTSLSLAHCAQVLARALVHASVFM